MSPAGHYNSFDIRRQAARLARGHSKTPSDSDPERQVHRVGTETTIRPAIEEERYREGRQAEEDFPVPPHADTAPSLSHNAAAFSSDQGIASQNVAMGKEPVGLSGNTAINGDAGLHQRAHFKEITRKNHHDAPPDQLELDGLTPEEKKKRALKKKIPIMSQIRTVLFSSWINVLLLFVPVGFALYYAHIKNGAVPVFIVNFIAIIPLAAMLSFATEELALRVGETFGGLLNASFGNAVELIVSIQALIKNEITIVKTSLIGSMLSNLLLVLGMSFFLGGINRLEQHFNVTVAQTASSLLALCIGSLIIPTVFHIMLVEDSAPDGKRNQELSRGTALILLFVYGCYLFFQLKSHVNMYNEPSEKTPKKESTRKKKGSTEKHIGAIAVGAAGSSGGPLAAQLAEARDEDDDFEEPQLTAIGALVTLALSTTMVAFCSEFMVSSIEGITGTGKISTTFVGLILLPIVGNAAEHATAVTVAMKDKMDLSIGVAVGSSTQIALLVLPLVVVLGWILGKDCMALYFDTFQISILFVAVLLVNYLIQDGKSHWLEGILLMASYLIIALAAWFYPNISEDKC